MVDISKLVQYDQTFPVDILAPDTGIDIGIKFNVVSLDSERVARVTKRIEAERWQAVFASEDKKLTPAQIIEYSEKMEREQLIAAIDSWEWGENEFGDLGVAPECTEANRRYVIEHQNAKWIRDQLAARASDIGNFTQPSKKPAKATSKR